MYLSYLGPVDESCRVDAEDAELVDDVLVDWRNCSLIFVQNQTDAARDCHADDEDEEYHWILHDLLS